jgi:peptidoglycan-N-acetylglucosamine deacetylase
MLWLHTPEADGGTRSFRLARGAIALTFDDGPDPRYTPHVLDVLADRGAHATFFVVGKNAERHPELIERILREGHEVAHHTHSHPHVDRISERELAIEMDSCCAVLASHRVSPAWYRPPRARLTPAQERLAAERGMRIALWARCFERSRFMSAKQMARTLAEETRDGDIVLAHDGLGNRAMTMEALPLYLTAMQQRRIAVVSLSELQSRGTW